MLITRFSQSALALGALLVVWASVPASASEGSQASDPHPSDKPELNYMSEEDVERNALLDPLWEIMTERPGFQDGGLVEGKNEVYFEWNGELDTTAKRAVDEARESGIPVSINKVPFTSDEIREYTLEIVEELDRNGILTGGFSSLLDPPTITIFDQDESTSKQLNEIANLVAERSLPEGIQLVIESRPEIGMFLDSRHNDGG